MKKLKNFNVAFLFLLAPLLGTACGSSDNSVVNPNPDNNTAPAPTVVIVDGTDVSNPNQATGVVAEDEVIRFSILIKAPGGFEEIEIQSDQVATQIISEGSEEFVYEYVRATADETPGEETLSITVVDQAGQMSEPLIVVLKFRLPAENLSVVLENRSEGKDKNAFLDLRTSAAYSLDDIEGDESIKEEIDLYYSGLVEPFLNSPGTVGADVQSWEDGVRNITLIKYVDKGLYAQISDLSELDKLLTLEQIFTEAAGEGSQEVEVYQLGNKAAAFKTASGQFGLLIGGSADPESIDLLYWITD